MSVMISFLAGLLFGCGLILSGMSNPAKVLGFLDIAGSWDPSLAFVMIGAIVTAAPAFALARRRSQAWSGAPLRLPERRDTDRRLVAGSLLFGIGWGIAGICPGPGLVLLGGGSGKGCAFVMAMLVGMGVFEWLESRKRRG